MWLFPRNPLNELLSQYEILEPDKNYSNERSIWTLHKAKKKSNNELLSAFKYDLTKPDSSDTRLAKQSLKRIKTLRHPSILRYVDSIENEKYILIFTESVTPLKSYIEKVKSEENNAHKDFTIAYGLSSVVKGLSFMNNDCQLNHNNINIHSIFVSTSGVWKIGGLDYVCSVDEMPPPLHEGLERKYIPPERLDPSKAHHPGGKFAVDSWGLGCLVWECFNKPLEPNSSVKTVGKMPKDLSVHYNKLVQSNPKHRCSPQDFINSCKKANVFFNNPLLQSVLYLEEIQLEKNLNAKKNFLTRLETQLESFPVDIVTNKILPDLLNANSYGECGVTILDPILKLSKLVQESDFKNILQPFIVQQYMLKDRSIRCKLLQLLDYYLDSFDQELLNERIFPLFLQGFLDSNKTVREITLSSVIQLAPKLHRTNLEGELLKYMVNLQTKDEPNIRVDAIKCLGDIWEHIHLDARDGIVLPALLRGLKDPFLQARHAAVRVLKDKKCYLACRPDALMQNIMITLCSCSTDVVYDIRVDAMEILKYLSGEIESSARRSIQKIAAKPADAEEVEAEDDEEQSEMIVVEKREAERMKVSINLDELKESILNIYSR